MNFPLTFRFKFFALAPQIFVNDPSGSPVFYIKEKLLKLRDAISVFTNPDQQQQVASINADRIIDFSARFNITDAQGRPLGAVARQGLRSMWRAHYEVFDHTGQPAGFIREESVLARMLDSLVAEIPVVGVLSIYVFQPKYLLTTPAGQPVMRLRKVPSWLDRSFVLEQLAPRSDYEEHRDTLAFLTMVLLERHRK